MDMHLPKFGIYQVTVAPNCLKIHTNFRCLDFFEEKILSDILSEIHIVRRNIVSIRQSVRFS